jgi:Predicted periplasmic protein (DUF2271)/Secretion system C-terminal sorting domain
MKLKLAYYTLLSVLLLTVPVLTIKAQSVVFKVTTVTFNGTYAPKHVIAVWITNSSGAYVKTINRQSNARTQYLTNWKTSSGTNTADGITGATLLTHNYAYSSNPNGVSRIPFNWNCNDFNGNLVADGTYYVNVEFTERNSTGKYVKYAFVKGSTTQTTNYPNVTTDPGKYFQNASVAYTAPITAIDVKESKNKYQVVYSTEYKQLLVKYEAQYHNKVKMSIYNQNGTQIISNRTIDESYSIDLSKIAKGLYIVKLTDQTEKGISYKVMVR